MADIYNPRTWASATSTAVNGPAPEPLTLDKLLWMMAGLAKPDVWLSTRMFPGNDALVVEGGSERFTVAQPGFWARLDDHLRKSEQVITRPPFGIGNPLYGFSLTPIEIDPWPGDDSATAKMRAGYWDRLIEAIKVALVTLPEWLRKPPEFTRFG